MPAIILIASWFGISPFRLIAYAAIGAAVIVGAITIRQHYIDAGFNSAMEKVKTQNQAAQKSAQDVQKTVDQCFAEGGTWSVITGDCQLQ